VTTPIDISLDALTGIAAKAGEQADAQARAAGIKPAALLKRLRERIAAAKRRLDKRFGRVVPGRRRMNQEPMTGARAVPRRRVGA
jgi:hypothetical protein